MSEEILEQTAEELEEEQQAVAESSGEEILETKAKVEETEEDEPAGVRERVHKVHRQRCVPRRANHPSQRTSVLVPQRQRLQLPQQQAPQTTDQREQT